jgi:ATP-binding protein involved in chromosome partitioning
MADITSIKKELEKVIYPGFTKSIVEFGFLKNVEVNGDTVSILVEITSSAQEVEHELRTNIKNVLEQIGITNLDLQVKKTRSTKAIK